MKVKNISNKIVHIGTTTILPDSEAIVSDEIGNSSPVRAIVELGIITVMETQPVEASTEETAVEEPAKKGGRKKKTEISEEEIAE